MTSRWIWLLPILWGASALADDVWVPPKGTLHTSVSFTEARWDEFLERGTTAVPLPGEISQYEFTTFTEYVPLENLSLDLTLPIVFSQKKFVHVVTDMQGRIVDVTLGPNGETRDTSTNSGIGDVTLGGKYMFWTKGISLGARPFLKLPGTYDSGDVVNAPGDGQTDLGLALLFGSYFMPIRAYIRGSVALVQRLGEPQNQMEFMIEPGVNITERLTARLTYQHIEQFGGDDILVYGLANFYPAVEEDVDRIGAGLTYRASDLLGIFGLYQQTVAGRNTGDTKVFTLGLDFSF